MKEILEKIERLQSERNDCNTILCTEIAQAWSRYTAREQVLIKMLHDLDKKLASITGLPPVNR